MFSQMKHKKSKNKSSISDGHLEQCLRLASTYLEADIYFLARKNKVTALIDISIFVNKLVFYLFRKFVFRKLCTKINLKTLHMNLISN